MDIIVKKQDIPKNKIIELSKRPKVLVVFDGKNYYAFNGICTHAKWPLDQGNLNENIGCWKSGLCRNGSIRTA